MHIERKAIITLILLSSLVAAGCSDKAETVATQSLEASNANIEVSTQSDEPEVTQEVTEDTDSLAVTKDDVTITIVDSKLSPMVGDRTADNVGQDNGEYFAIGSDIVKASDYEQIVVNVSIENKASKAITFSEMGWSVKLPDGYKLEGIKATGKASEQMASNQTGEGSIVIMKEKGIAVEKLVLTYAFLDYGDEWNEAISKVMSGDMGEKEYKDKFTPQEMKFELTL